MAHVSSSAIDDVAYDRATATLTIRFTSGERYHYRDVPPDVAAGLLAAPSHGRYFQAHIRDRYRHRRDRRRLTS